MTLLFYKGFYISVAKISMIVKSNQSINDLIQVETSVTFPNMTAQEVTDFFSEAGITIENV